MASRKRFKEYSQAEQLIESSWLSKGFAIGQSNRHAGILQQLNSTAQQIKSICDRGRLEDDNVVKLNLLFDAMSRLAGCMKLQGDLSRSAINVSISTNLLEDDLTALIKKALHRP